MNNGTLWQPTAPSATSFPANRAGAPSSPARLREPFEILSRTTVSRLSGEELEDYNEARMVWNANLPTIKTSPLAAQ